MRLMQLHPRGVVAVVALALAACGSGGSAEDTSTGDVSAGDVSAGDVSTGDVSAGDVSAGDVLTGDVSTGDVSTTEPDASPSGDAGVGLDADPGPTGLTTYTPCSYGVNLGGFAVTLEESYTSVLGIVADGVSPTSIPALGGAAGDCMLYEPRSLFCDPPCGAGEACDDDNTCTPYPSNMDVGTVTIDGLSHPVEMTSKQPVWFYTHIGALDHPAFGPGDAITLEAAGGGVEAFTLQGAGIEPLDMISDAMPMEVGVPALLEWTPQADAGSPARVQLHVSIANHGGVPAFIACDVDDTGSYEIPALLVESLLAVGASGWPSVGITRQTVDSVDSALGCIQLAIVSEVVLPITIPGLVSCSVDDDCPDGQVCRVDLSCGDS